MPTFFRPLNDQHAKDIAQIKKLRQQLGAALDYHNGLMIKVLALDDKLALATGQADKDKWQSEQNQLLNAIDEFNYDDKRESLLAQIHPLEIGCFGFAITNILIEGGDPRTEYLIGEPQQRVGRLT
jgi:hypothetical protein